MKNHLQQAEALFAGLSNRKLGAPPPETEDPERVEPSTKPAEEAVIPRRRVIIRGPSVTPSPIVPAAEAHAESLRTEVLARMSEAIRDLGGIENPDERRARRQEVVPTPVVPTALTLSEDLVPEDAFLVRVRAPTVRAEDICFIFEGRDVARVTDRAMAQVAGYMSVEHAGATWNMRSIERIPNVLRQA